MQSSPEESISTHDEIKEINTQEIRVQDEVHDDVLGYPLNAPLVHRLQQRELNKRNSKLKELLSDPKSEYKIQEILQEKLITYKGKIYIPEPLRGRLLNWYHEYLCHPGGDRLYKTLSQICYWKGMSNQATRFCRRCPICQRAKRRRTRYGHLPAKDISNET